MPSEPEDAGVALAVAPSLIALAEWLAEKGGPAWALEIALADSEQHPREFRIGWERGFAAALAASNARAERLEAELAEIHSRGYGHLYANELHEQGHRAWMHTPDPAKCWCEPLAGDAPGRGEG